jgi:pimeloyl-ACP methyl ester carboxylesterase
VGTTQIAFIKFESPEQPVKGDILINPGGPANSATGGMLADIAGIVTLLGTSYNIVGMDPRAVNNSGPNGDCFPGATYDRDFYNSYVLSVNHDPTDAASLKDYWHRAGTLDEWCSQTLNETARYITTMATARDMLQYFEKLAESKDENPDEAKVNLYGTSYGTVLGTTFARIYPDRVGRFILDGVVDGIDYYNGQWLTTLLQADEAIADFFVKCEEAGPLCTFFRNDTAAEMQKRFDAILADLEKNRIWITDPAMVNYPTYVTDLDLRAVTIGLLYNALTGYPVLDVIFTGLETRNATVLYYAMSGYNVNKGKVPTEADISTAYAEGQPTYEVRLPRLSITCNDMNGQYNISSPEMFEEYAKKQFEASKYLAHGFAGLVSVNCWNWKFKPSESQIFPGELNPIL